MSDESLQEELARRTLKEIESMTDRIGEMEDVAEKNSRNISSLITNFKRKSTTDNNAGGNGAIKGIGIIGLIVTLLAGLVAIGEYMGKENEYIRKDMVRSEDKVIALSTKVDELAKKQAEVVVLFKDVQTQFKGQQKIIELEVQYNKELHKQIDAKIYQLEQWLTWWNQNIPGKDAQQDAYINVLREYLENMKKFEQDKIIHNNCTTGSNKGGTP